VEVEILQGIQEVVITLEAAYQVTVVFDQRQ
jgi:hypothetical protein